MITLYRIVIQKEPKMCYKAMPTNIAGKYRYTLVESGEFTEKETLKTISFPNSIFTYEGWYIDYNEKRLYRWKNTQKEQVFLLDESLINAASENIIPPDEWLKVTGNQIIIEYYDKCKYYDSDLDDGNPSGHKGNVWLMSYRRADNTEVYLYEYKYNEDDEVVSQTALEPRTDVNKRPGKENSQLNVVVHDDPIDEPNDQPTQQDEPGINYDESQDNNTVEDNGNTPENGQEQGTDTENQNENPDNNNSESGGEGEPEQGESSDESSENVQEDNNGNQEVTEP